MVVIFLVKGTGIIKEENTKHWKQQGRILQER
jgi:hypothetical protein